MKRSAVVFGATGLVGTELIKELKSDDRYDQITAVVRSELRFQHPRINQLILSDYDNLSDHIRKLSVTDYFCCIGTTIKIAGTRDAFRKVDYGIPVRIAGMAQKLNIPNLIIISSIGADAKSRNFYLRTKGEMEETVREIYKGNLKFIRPSLLIGDRKDHRTGEKLGAAFMKAFGWAFIGPFKKFKGIQATTVARAMIHAANLPANILVMEGSDLFAV